MAIISARLEADERRQLRVEAKRLGFDTFSDFIRHKIGLERLPDFGAPVLEMDSEQDNNSIVRAIHELVERLDNMNANMKIIAKHVGASLKPDVRVREPRAEAPANGEFQR